MMRGLATALGFLTRLPVPRVAVLPGTQAASLKWYPLVGLVLGVLLACAMGWLLRVFPVLPAAAIVLVVWVALTGALHLDGLGDSADAWIGGMGSRDRTLAIMKDPRSGPAGIVALVLLLLLKFAALATLADPWLLLLPPLLGRAAIVAWFLTTPYVRTGGLGDPLRGAPASGCRVALAASTGLALCFGMTGLIALAAAFVAGWLWRRAVIHRLGGFTGDTAGALVELVEAVTVVVLVVTL
ncbi:adenosylcobinamide-GDP ribazoletransferase [Luteibacter yeojuensis]|uniref:Adenosylcobinamide-GDP ribazoletransferase n=1 Tax=Luteibacter yeojuensis TaxID=345309 RepID=A0A7X5TSM0_9GAMM|nr:adenosylcobinamide-GDP ribazoletransferase [Luteibacter yeojuensis]NID17402.1 adenosylcobinamide-GDP ribazoletransferase [Luteibacter yeojuensis]